MEIAEFKAQIGQEIGLSRWFTMDQARIDDFARITEDPQFIHIDPEAAAKTPFGGTIAHGFLTLSMLSAMAMDVLAPLAGEQMSVNYGADRIRFISPVPSGARIRGRFVLAALEERKPGELTAIYDTTVEIEGSDTPALIAHWIGRRYVTQTQE